MPDDAPLVIQNAKNPKRKYIWAAIIALILIVAACSIGMQYLTTKFSVELKFSSDDYSNGLREYDNKNYYEALNSFERVIPLDIIRFGLAHGKIAETRKVYIDEEFAQVSTYANSPAVALIHIDKILVIDQNNETALKLKTQYQNDLNVKAKAAAEKAAAEKAAAEKAAAEKAAAEKAAADKVAAEKAAADKVAAELYGGNRALNVLNPSWDNNYCLNNVGYSDLSQLNYYRGYAIMSYNNIRYNRGNSGDKATFNKILQACLTNYNILASTKLKTWLVSNSLPIYINIDELAKSQ